MSDINEKAFDEIILDQELDLNNSAVYFALAKCYKEGKGVEENLALSDFFERVGETLNNKATNSFLASTKEADALDIDNSEMVEEEELTIPPIINNPFNEEENINISFYQDAHENTKNKIIEEATLQYQEELKKDDDINIEEDEDISLTDEKDIRFEEIEEVKEKEDTFEEVEEIENEDIPIFEEENEEDILAIPEESIVEDIDIKSIDSKEVIDAKKQYEEALSLIDDDKYNDALVILKNIVKDDKCNEEIKARTLFILALAYPDANYPKEAVDIAWKNSEEEYSRSFLEYYYANECDEEAKKALSHEQLKYLNMVEDSEVEEEPSLEVPELFEKREVEVDDELPSFEIDEEENKETEFEDEELNENIKKIEEAVNEDTGSTSILHETAKLEKLILDDEELDLEELESLRKFVE